MLVTPQSEVKESVVMRDLMSIRYSKSPHASGEEMVRAPSV